MSDDSHFNEIVKICFEAAIICKELEKKAITFIDVNNEFKSIYDYRIIITQTDNPIKTCLELLQKFPQLLTDPVFGYLNLLSQCIKIALYRDALAVNNIIYNKLLCYIGKTKFDLYYPDSVKFWKRVLDVETTSLSDLASLIASNTRIIQGRQPVIISFKQLQRCIDSLVIISDRSDGELGEVNVFIEICKAILA